MSDQLLLISAGQGPAECARAVFLLAETLQNEAAAAGLQVDVVHKNSHPEKRCFRSVTLRLSGESAVEFASANSGSVLWRCPSPFRAQHGRKNWYIGVSRFSLPSERDPSLGQVRVEFFRASGPGGQHVNKTQTGVRIHHLQSGLTISASEERSQARNRKRAFAKLWALLLAENQDRVAQTGRDRHQAHQQLERGNPIRTFKGPGFKPYK